MSTRSFRAPAALRGMVRVDQTTDLPIQQVVVTSYVDVPSDWLPGAALDAHLEHMQETAIASLEKQGYEYDGGPFVWKQAGTRHVCPGGFAIRGPQPAFDETGGVSGRVPWHVTEVDGKEVWRPVKGEKVRYLLAARYRKRAYLAEILVPEVN